MAKILCALYDDPVNGYPKSYPWDGIPKIDRYPGGQSAPTPKHIDFKPGELLGSVSGELGLRKFLEGLSTCRRKVTLFLLGSRYCETDRLSDEAWRLFGNTPLGWPRVQAICGFAHNHLIFGYEHSRVTRTVFEAHQERFAVAFCRCLNIPARYCTGYITDIGLPPPYALMDFSAWIEVYLGHRWYAFDPRNNAPPDRPYSHCAGPRRRRRASNQYVWSRKFVRVFASGQMKCRQDDTPPSRAFFAQALVRGSATRSRGSGGRYWLADPRRGG
jgi:transglutaminase-like putative cysteine protease